MARLQNRDPALHQFFILEVDVHHQVAVNIAEPGHGAGGEHVRIIFCAVPAFMRLEPAMTSGPTSVTIATCAAFSSCEPRLQVTAIGLGALAARVLNGGDGEWSASAGGDADDDIVLARLLFGDFALAEFARIFVAFDGRPRAFTPPAMTNCTVFGSVLKVGGHSAASSAAMRPLVPAPT